MSRKSRQNKLTRRLKKLPSLEQAIFFLVAGLILGTVFTFGMRYWQGPVTADEARPVSAVMQDVRGDYRKPRHGTVRLRGILIRFEDYEQLDIASPVATKAMLEQLSTYAAGTTFDMLVHPNSATILALTVEGKEIVNFDEAVAALAGENTGFFWLGAAMYVFAAVGAVTAVIRLKLRRY